MASLNENFADGVEAALRSRGCKVKSTVTNCGVKVVASNAVGADIVIMASDREVRMNRSKSAYLALVKHKVKESLDAAFGATA